MKRDEHLMRLLLLELEGEKKVDLSEFSEEQIGHHKYLLLRGGLAEGVEDTGLGAKYRSALLTGITNNGHDFLSSSEKSHEAQTRMGDIYISGNVGSGAAVGHQSNVKAENIAERDVVIGTDPKAVAAAFDQIYAAIEAKPFSSETDAQEVREAVEIIESENKKGKTANEKVIRLSMRNLARMAPDILEVVVTTLTNPVLGMSTVVRKIAEKAKTEAGGKTE